MAHHQEAHRIHAELAGVFQVLARHVGLGAVGCHAHDARACVVGIAQVVRGADAGQQQGRDLGGPDRLRHCGDPFDIGVRAKAVVEAGAFQPVAVRDLDAVDAGGVQCRGDRLDLRDAVLVANGMAAVTQGHIADVELPGRRHASSFRPRAMPPAMRRCAIRSAHASAAEVMMSRLPA